MLFNESACSSLLFDHNLIDLLVWLPRYNKIIPRNLILAFKCNLKRKDLHCLPSGLQSYGQHQNRQSLGIYDNKPRVADGMFAPQQRQITGCTCFFKKLMSKKYIYMCSLLPQKRMEKHIQLTYFEPNQHHEGKAQVTCTLSKIVKIKKCVRINCS